MIKAEVVFDGDDMRLNGWRICYFNIKGSYRVYKHGVKPEYFIFIEHAIKHCLEN